MYFEVNLRQIAALKFANRFLSLNSDPILKNHREQNVVSFKDIVISLTVSNVMTADIKYDDDSEEFFDELCQLQQCRIQCHHEFTRNLRAHCLCCSIKVPEMLQISGSSQVCKLW